MNLKSSLAFLGVGAAGGRLRAAPLVPHRIFTDLVGMTTNRRRQQATPEASCGTIGPEVFLTKDGRDLQRYVHQSPLSWQSQRSRRNQEANIL